MMKGHTRILREYTCARFTQTEFTGHKEQTTNNTKNSAAAATAPRGWVLDRCGNDPSAGSPTDTLLRLHLPLNGKV